MIGKIFTVRWIGSSYRAIKALRDDYPALYTHFKKFLEDMSIKPTERATYQGIVKNLSTREFVEDVAVVRLIRGFVEDVAIVRLLGSILPALRSFAKATDQFV